MEVFANTPFVLNSYDMFQNLNSMVVNSLLIIDQLSFDIIAFVVAAKDVLEYYEESMSSFQSGGQAILSSFRDLCQSFLEINIDVRQAHLNKINRQFRNIIVSLNDTMFPNSTQRMEQIIKKFEGYQFRSEQLKKLFINSMTQLRKFAAIIEENKEEIYTKMKHFSDQVISLIDKLEIGSLNSIYELANAIKDEFSAFFSSYPSMLRELLDFKTFVDKDFRKIFTFKAFFASIKSKV